MASIRKMDMREFADQAFKAVMRENRDKVVADTTFVSAFQGFVHAVNWREVRARARPHGRRHAKSCRGAHWVHRPMGPASVRQCPVLGAC